MISEHLLVLDDVHLVSGSFSRDAIAALALHAGQGSQIILSGRGSEGLPIARLRAARRLWEIGAADLALDEAARRPVLLVFSYAPSGDFRDDRRLFEHPEPGRARVAGAGDIHRPWLSPLSIATRERYSGDLYEMSDARRSEVGIELLPANPARRRPRTRAQRRAAVRSGPPATATTPTSSAASGRRRTSRSPSWRWITTCSCINREWDRHEEHRCRL
jgi:hypothetical protein